MTDGLPATALCFNSIDANIMSRPPRGRKEKIVDGWQLTKYIVVGCYVGLATTGIFVFYYCFYSFDPDMHSLIGLRSLMN